MNWVPAFAGTTTFHDSANCDSSIHYCPIFAGRRLTECHECRTVFLHFRTHCSVGRTTHRTVMTQCARLLTTGRFDSFRLFCLAMLSNYVSDLFVERGLLCGNFCLLLTKMLRSLWVEPTIHIVPRILIRKVFEVLAPFTHLWTPLVILVPLINDGLTREVKGGKLLRQPTIAGRVFDRRVRKYKRGPTLTA